MALAAAAQVDQDKDSNHVYQALATRSPGPRTPQDSLDPESREDGFLSKGPLRFWDVK